MKRLLLLLNMGGPNNIDEVEVFLKNMFNDPCVLGIKSAILRKFIAFLIVNARLKTSKHNYEQIGGKSPICEITAQLCEKISSMASKFDAVDFAMNYTSPFAVDVLKKYENFDEIIVFPLYPHESVTTTKSSIDSFVLACNKLNISPKVRAVEPFFNSKIYNSGIISDIKEAVKNLDTSSITLIFSAHSLPQKIIDKGDKYEAHINAHIAILKDMLQANGLKFKDVRLAYQSRLGNIKWLEPSLNDVLSELEEKKALIYPISFCIDNSETIFELHKEFKTVADKLGYEFYDVVKCPNFSDWFVEFIIENVTE